MKKFASEISEREILQRLFAKLPWGHIISLLDKVKSEPERVWYAKEDIQYGWSQAVLIHQIESQLYHRQAKATKITNFDRLLPPEQSELAKQQLKDPYVFDFIGTRQDMMERELEDLLVHNITKMLLELGQGFAFLGHQYHIVVGGEDFYIDLLFYNVKLHCYFVIELKTGAFQPEYAGKLNFYLSAVDSQMRGEGDAPTIGLILCKGKNDIVAEYSLRDMTKPMGVSAYQLTRELPEILKDALPSGKDFERL
jgi:predicted nuclease of restriction endonuclease-like (RecB) superfamily